MTCHSLRDTIVELARGRDAGPGTRVAIESHIEHCAACAALMTREQQLSQGLRALAEATAAEVAPEALGRRLVDAFAERQSTSRAVVRPATGWMRAAAALLLAGGAAAWWWTARGEPATEGPLEPHAVIADARRPEPAHAPGVVPTGDSPRTVPAVSGRPRLRVARHRAAPAFSVIHPVGFVALPGAAGLPDFESGQIIRMEIPLTSLPTYGIEIQPDAQGSPVEADLLVGQDGQARAIRLVTTSAAR
jgi:anti-sigma factor RsiW